MGNDTKRKSKNKEVKGIQDDIDSVIAGLPPATRTRWFAFNPNASGSSKYQENISPLPSPQKPRRTLKRRATDDDIKTEPIDLSLDSDSDVQVFSSPTKSFAFYDDNDNDNDSPRDHSPPKKKKKSAMAADSDEEADDSVDMSFCIEVETPAPPVLSIRTKNAKPLPPKTTLLGPFEFSSSISYPDFIRIVAKACRTQTENLIHSSMQWKFDRPNNAKRRPLTNAVGLGIAIKTLKERKKDYAFTLFMAPPSPIKAELPWLTDSNEDDPAGPLDFGFSIDELTAPGTSTLSLREQIAGIDKASNPHFTRLLEKYPVGNNPQFPGKRIYHNETGFFELTDVRLRVWAVAMAKGVATEDNAPVSNHFAKGQTIRPPQSAAPAPATATAFPNLSTTSNDLLQFFIPALQALTQGHNIPFALPSYYPHQYPLPPFGASVPPPPLPPFGAAVQPPPAPSAAVEPVPTPPVALPRIISLEEYCERYKLDAEDQRVLVELGYKPGDGTITELDKEIWEVTKVTPLAKFRILRQHASFLKDVTAGLWN